MQRSSLPWGWIALAALLLLLPSSFGRILLDVLGGLTLTLLLLPLLAGGAALIGWRILQSRMRTCQVCGVSSLGVERCPACGSSFSFNPESADEAVDPRNATITVVAQNVKEDQPGGESPPRS